jgi:hypothetical protein
MLIPPSHIAQQSLLHPPPSSLFDLSTSISTTHSAPLEVEFIGALHSDTDLLPIASVSSPSTAISPNTICSLPSPVLHCHYLSLLLILHHWKWNWPELSGGLWRSFPQSWSSLGSIQSHLPHYIYILCPPPYWICTLQQVATFTLNSPESQSNWTAWYSIQEGSSKLLKEEGHHSSHHCPCVFTSPAPSVPAAI